jgi:hypothetical protein
MRSDHAGDPLRIGGCVIGLVLCGALWWAAGAAASPMDVSGSVGYTYRSLKTNFSDSDSNELLGILRASTYIWQPWFATAEGGITLTEDHSNLSDNSDGSFSSSQSSNIVSGDLVLNVLPDSKTPFRLSYQATDSRVDNTTITNPIIRLSGEDFKTTSLDLSQAYITDAGTRFQADYGDRTWTSDVNGDYTDQTAGLELDYKPAGQRLLARASVENIDQSNTDRHQDNKLLDVNHYYYPTEALRIDSTASLYNLDTTFSGATGLVDTQVTDITQASSFAFWRPDDRRWTVSGGIRAMEMKGSNSAQSSTQRSFGATAGAFYQYTQRLRFDGNISFTNSDVAGANQNSSQEHLGALYQSDLIDFKHYTYSWFGSAGIDNQSDPGLSMQSLSASLGHDLQRVWWRGDRTTIRFSLNQSVNAILQSGSEAEPPCSDPLCQTQSIPNDLMTNGASSTLRLDDSATLAWNQSADTGTTLVQLTLGDSRNLGSQQDNQQLINFQASRLQNISRLSMLTGDLTLQTVRRHFLGQPNNDTVTSATGRITYQHMRIFGVTNLQFQSDLSLSEASTDEGADRNEWENSLNYTIGMVEASLSYRILNDGVNDSRLLYFRVMRRF